MHILVIDGDHVEAEFREKFGPAHEYTFWDVLADEVECNEKQRQFFRETLKMADVVFFSQFIEARYYFLLEPGKFVVFQEAASMQLFASSGNWPTFGFCGLPTLLNRSLLEVSLYHEADREKLAETCAALGTDYRIVADRVGLVTPRVICQIINEACFTVQEGTATMQDVDLGMKLGTNYPRGPFAWANAIGVERVYAVLEALWDDTHDERYKVCPLLKRQALRGEPFAV